MPRKGIHKKDFRCSVPDDAGDGKVVHLIVHDDAGGGGHELAAPDQVDARRYCACVVSSYH